MIDCLKMFWHLLPCYLTDFLPCQLHNTVITFTIIKLCGLTYALDITVTIRPYIYVQMDGILVCLLPKFVCSSAFSVYLDFQYTKLIVYAQNLQVIKYTMKLQMDQTHTKRHLFENRKDKKRRLFFMDICLRFCFTYTFSKCDTWWNVRTGILIS